MSQPDQKLTHLTEDGAAHMVDVGHKQPTKRRATASAKLTASESAISALFAGDVPKGDAIAVARVAGIMAAKSTATIIPLCHPLALSKIEISIDQSSPTTVAVSAIVETNGPTGVEMEALTAVSATALTLYDMLKALDKSMIISDVQLETKTGGKSGDYKRV